MRAHEKSPVLRGADSLSDADRAALAKARAEAAERAKAAKAEQAARAEAAPFVAEDEAEAGLYWSLGLPFVRRKPGA